MSSGWNRRTSDVSGYDRVSSDSSTINDVKIRPFPASVPDRNDVVYDPPWDNESSAHGCLLSLHVTGVNEISEAIVLGFV